jgi:glycosyltransferase involved in cell wall biosynthesis
MHGRILKDKFKEKIRLLLSFGPKVGLVPKASRFREKGISVFIRVRNEEYWIRPCILSIKDSVDEILLIDNGSTDSTLDIVEKIRKEVSTPIRIFSLPEADHCEVSNVGIRESRYSWLLKWDADFIAQTEGSGDFSRLRNYILGLDQDRYHMIFMSLVNLAGDLWHQPKAKEVCSYMRSPGPLHREAYLWNYSPEMKYVWKDYRGFSKVESLLFPLYHRFLEWPELSVFHVGGIRPIDRMMIDYFWGQWKKRYSGIAEVGEIPYREAFAWENAKRLFHTADKNIILKKFFSLMKNDLVSYDNERYGSYPPSLSPYLENPWYRIIYNNANEIIGRFPDCMWDA